MECIYKVFFIADGIHIWWLFEKERDIFNTKSVKGLEIYWILCYWYFPLNKTFIIIIINTLSLRVPLDFSCVVIFSLCKTNEQFFGKMGGGGEEIKSTLQTFVLEK